MLQEKEYNELNKCTFKPKTNKKVSCKINEEVEVKGLNN